jgi:hypothetical protein
MLLGNNSGDCSNGESEVRREWKRGNLKMRDKERKGGREVASRREGWTHISRIGERGGGGRERERETYR